jgi:hypothetical protein
VRLRFAFAVNEKPLIAYVDDVSVTSALLPTPILLPTPQPTPTSPSNSFGAGKLTRNRKNGTGFLTLNLPGAGRLTVFDARREVAVASAAALGGTRARPTPKPILIRTATLQTAGAQTVRVPLRPTPAAKKRLATNGKLPFRLQLTFAPAGGTVSTEGYKGTLLKRLKPARK